MDAAILSQGHHVPGRKPVKSVYAAWAPFPYPNHYIVGELPQVELALA